MTRALCCQRTMSECQSKRNSGTSTCNVFFSTNRINNLNELQVKHCSTNEMTANHFIKPLQEKKFKKFFRQIMKKKAHLSVHTSNPNKRQLNNRSVLNERLKERTVNGKCVRFSLTNKRETAREMSIDEREWFGTVRSCERDIKREIMSNSQPSKQ